MTDTTLASTEPTLPHSGLAKTFDPAAIEAKWAAHWEAEGLFRPHRPDAVPYTIVNPPPNVTGALHIGHALDNTLQDVLIRYERLRGKDALWVVGTDHAGIATQMVVERQMAVQQDKRTNYSREDFIAKVWEWKAQSGGEITGQLRRLGCSMDWGREQFTMDPHFTKAVMKVFVDLYNEGLLYRDKRLVNWDPHFKSAISDLEVETREVAGHMWHFKYPLAGGQTYRYVERDADGAIVVDEERDYISIATTRPETMLGDGAVAVHPGDERYRPIVGMLCEIPVGPKQHRRLIPIITDEYPDPDFGSGAVKITGAHDANDYGVAQRNGIPMYRLMDEDAAMRKDGAPYAETAAQAKAIAGGGNWTAAEIDALNLVPDAYRGLDRYDARKRVVADIDADGLMIRVEDKQIMQPFGDRSNVVIEPMLTDQWYVDAKTLAQPAIEAVKSGAIDIVPKSWEKTFFNWMDNIQPWCVSRQLWWGHQIPAWYGFNKDRTGVPVSWKADSADTVRSLSEVQVPFIASTVEAAIELAREYYTGIDDSDRFEIVPDVLAGAQSLAGFVPLWQDPDVLDTWFSSALWPFATLGWPEGESPSPLAGEGGETQLSRVRGESVTEPPSPSAADAAPPSPARGEGLLARHYPNDVLISGFDILFFWDARMMMQGLHFMGEAPWKTLYLHGLVRAPDGQKMSKSKGNVIDPLGLIDRYGADALRFFMAAMESQGRDIKMDDARLEGYRNFATKLWNAARFCEANGIGASDTLAAPPAALPVNRWIIGEVADTVTRIDDALAAYRFDDAANAIYQFAWGTFCDWYLELIKPVLSSLTYAPATIFSDSTTEDQRAAVLKSHEKQIQNAEEHDAARKEIRIVAGWVLDQILVLLHPFMPFITEELWSAQGTRAHYPLITAQWPEPSASVDAEAKAEIEWLTRLVSEIRSVRTERNVPPATKLRCIVWADADQATLDRVKQNEPTIEKLARISEVGYTNHGVSGDAAQLVVDGVTYALLLEGTIDVSAERARLSKALEAAQKDAASLAARLANPAFTERAKPEAVDKAREDHAARAAEADRLSAALARLG